MNKCIHRECQFEDFFEKEELYYIRDSDNNDEYCIFHAPERIKDNFTYYQNELFQQSIRRYIDYCDTNSKPINFSYTIFHVPFEQNNIDVSGLDIDFTETVFIEYFRMDNLKCRKLILRDTEFYDGGGIKNRDGIKKVNIENLIFRPYILESDFVIDIGKYANKKGYIESNNYGLIINIKFENHKKGKGIIYFIGLNKYTNSAIFRNMILDNVSFQNCDLCKCYFLNAKVDKTEFRSCEFPQIHQGATLYVVDEYKHKGIILLTVGIIGTVVVLYILGNNKDLNFPYGILAGVWYLLPVLAILIMIPLASTIYHLEFLISLFIPENKHKNINKIKTIHYHKGIADELSINTDFTSSKENKIKIQDTIAALESVYRQLKINFSKHDFQFAGDFFFAQRLMEIYGAKSKDNLVERSILAFHYTLNGFGEKFIKPMIFFIGTLFMFSSLYVTNVDFISTEKTPMFLLDNNITTLDGNKSDYYKTQVVKEFVSRDINESQHISERRIKREYISRTLNSTWETRFVYSLSQFISPFNTKNREWFKTISPKSSILNIIETILLYIFFGAFLLAVKNRIKR